MFVVAALLTYALGSAVRAQLRARQARQAVTVRAHQEQSRRRARE